MTFLLLGLIVFMIALIESKQYNVEVNISDIIRDVPSPFYGFTIDWWKPDDPRYGQKWGNAGFLSVDLTNETFIALVKEISPGILRIGGSPQDSIIYNVSGACLDVNSSLPGYGCSQVSNNYGCMTIQRWIDVNTFAIETGVELIFGLNACYGRESSTSNMNFSNIEALFEYSQSSMNQTLLGNLKSFELANELTRTINVNTYSQDIFTLNGLMKKYFNNIRPPIGYDDGYNSEYAKTMFNNLANYGSNNNISDLLYHFTYHEYPNCEYPNGNITVFDVGCLESIHTTANNVNSLVNEYGITSWMGEGSEHSGGGTPNVSNTFIDTFYYIYELCDILQYGTSGTIRSDLIGGDYELIDHNTFIPNPDYWILYLWKQLIGNIMYNVNIPNLDDNIRSFAFNSKNNNDIAIILINFSLNIPATFEINTNNNQYNYNQYLLKPNGINLNTTIMYVNDVKMEYSDNKFPIINGNPLNGNIITVDPARIVFLVGTPK